ncbi:alpha/beta hydrolase family protein [Candidatus Roseilinea sp. NK_OTU-006]|uniref:alpha/beta hydrolase family protein n=1 Tax=Candidatus Roseilinea sp. NK_OTU-006 TaxID=2704250 RepID=UPI00145D8C2C|nr:hypothetical protein [Candidatus Roseilinea sp. NK_OTU-006]
MGSPSDRASMRSVLPLNYVKHMRAPALIIYGERDARMHLSGFAQFVVALKREGKNLRVILKRVAVLPIRPTRSTPYGALSAFWIGI